MAEIRFPDPHEYVKTAIPPELEGWEEMYPPHFLFCEEEEERAKWEKRQFWYLDKIHAPDPMPPLDHIFQQAWQISLSQHNTRVFCIPPAQGVAHRIVGCYQYICAVEPPPEEIIQEKSELFKERGPYVVEHYDEIWEEWFSRFRQLGEELKRLKIPELPKYLSGEEVYPHPYRGYTQAYELIEAFHNMVNMVYKAWQYHFNLLNLCYLYFLTFSDNVKKLFPGISDSTIGKMVAGVEAYMFKPQEELASLARLAFSEPRVKEILMKDIPAEEKIKELKKIPEGEVWLQKFEETKDPWFYVNCGSGWYHYEGSWKDKLDLPFSYLKGYLERLERGENIERLMAQIQKEREELFQQYKALIPNEEDRESLEKLYRDSLTLYRFAEGHIFWVEHWFHTIWFDKARELGDVLVKAKVLKEVDDIFMFNRLEIPTLIEDAVTAWALGEGVPTRDWISKAKRRRDILEAAKKWSPSPALGVAPEVIAEPFTIMLWGVTTEKAEEWLKGLSVEREKVEEIKGFPASKGVVEGPARVVRSLEELQDLQEGEILVCPSTNPSWAPVFARIKAAVTDIGGVTCHAAIVAREFGLPSVTGTGIATQVIRTGDIIRVDGDNGVVRIIKRTS